MNLYYIDAGEKRFFANKTNAHNAAQSVADRVQHEVTISRMFIAVDRDILLVSLIQNLDSVNS